VIWAWPMLDTVPLHQHRIMQRPMLELSLKQALELMLTRMMAPMLALMVALMMALMQPLMLVQNLKLRLPLVL
jgi:hypothetical protein